MGDVELTGNPRVQQGLNTHVATSPDTVMILNEAGQLTTHGPSRTEIRQEPKAEPKTPQAVIGEPCRQPRRHVCRSATKPVEHENVLATEQLVKIYGGRAVVNGIDINVRAGEIVGLARPERRRQDDELLHDRWARPAEQRPRHFLRRRT